VSRRTAPLRDFPVIFWVIGLFLLSPASAAAARTYSLLIDQPGFLEQTGDPNKSYFGPRTSRFEILEDNDAEYVVRFSTIATMNAVRMAAVAGTFGGKGGESVKDNVNYTIKKEVA
jgi:hypothetical protein